LKNNTSRSLNNAEIPNHTDYHIALGNNKFLVPGGVYDGERLLRQVTLRPTTGFDEEAVGTTEVSGKNWRITDTLLSRCITAIEDIVDPNKIEQLVPKFHSGDRVALLFMLEKISSGDVREIDVQCPGRGGDPHTFKHEVDIDKLTYHAYSGPPPRVLTWKLKDGVEDVTTHQLVYDVELRPMLGSDEKYLQPHAQVQNMGALRSAILEACVTRIGAMSPIHPILLKKMSGRDRRSLTDLLDTYDPSPDMTFDVRCTQCGLVNKGLARPENFFGG
jgi:hypothetical protein